MTFEPGVYDAIPDYVYHADKTSLSSSGARAILKSPAQFRYDQDHVRPAKKEFDFGHAAHSLVLGVGAELREIPEPLLASNGAVSTRVAKDFVAQARTDGAIAMKPDDYRKVKAMAAALTDNPYAKALFEAEGQAEQSIYWDDPDTDTRLRARPDWMTRPGDRLIIVDYKSTVDSEPRAFEKHATRLGYHCQDPFYRDGVIAAGLDDDPEFLFVAQSKEPPYLVSVTRFGPDSVGVGRRANRRAINLFADCARTGNWPGHVRDIYEISLSKWALNNEENELS